jgi:hypothetical protein
MTTNRAALVTPAALASTLARSDLNPAAAPIPRRKLRLAKR